MPSITFTALSLADALNSRGGWKKASPKKQKGYMALCPNHADRNPSLSVRETERGKIRLKCFATSCTDDRDVYSAVERAMNLEPGYFGRSFDGYSPAARPDKIKHQRKDFNPISPVPDDAPKFEMRSRRFKSSSHGFPVTAWTYRNAQGRPMGYVARYEKANEDGSVDKMIWPWTFGIREGRRQWCVGAMAEPRVPYNLDKIVANPDAFIQWHEGEKAADAGGILFPNWIPTTTVGGGNAPHLTDFEPFRNRTVILCRDNDAAGIEYVGHVAQLLQAVGAKVFLLRFPTAFVVQDGKLAREPYSLNPGDDMHDHLSRGWTTDLIREAIALSGLPLTWSLDEWDDCAAS